MICCTCAICQANDCRVEHCSGPELRCDEGCQGKADPASSENEASRGGDKGDACNKHSVRTKH